MKNGRVSENEKEAGEGSFLRYVIAESIVKNAIELLNFSVGSW